MIWPFKRKLHVFSNEVDMVVARNLAEAQRLWSEITCGDVDADEWHMVADDYEFSIWCDENGVPDEPGPLTRLFKRTAAEWAAKMGAGFLCSSEY